MDLSLTGFMFLRQKFGDIAASITVCGFNPATVVVPTYSTET